MNPRQKFDSLLCLFDPSVIMIIITKTIKLNFISRIVSVWLVLSIPPLHRRKFLDLLSCFYFRLNNSVEYKCESLEHYLGMHTRNFLTPWNKISIKIGMIIFWPHDLMIMTSGGAQGFSGLGEREVGNTGNFLGVLGSKLTFWGCREPRGIL